MASGGITTSLILPGSGNLMGGEAAVIKLRPVSTLSAQDMLVTSGVSDEDQEVIWRYMKMACGENPKTFYGSSNRMPSTRKDEKKSVCVAISFSLFRFGRKLLVS